LKVDTHTVCNVESVVKTWVVPDDIAADIVVLEESTGTGKDSAGDMVGAEPMMLLLEEETAVTDMEEVEGNNKTGIEIGDKVLLTWEL